MATSSVPDTADRAALPSPRERVLPVAVLAAGVGFVVEAVVSVLVDSHAGYHALNVPLNAALLVKV